MLKKIICLLLIIACCFSLSNCSKGEDNNNSSVIYPADVLSINDFKCVCSTDDESEFLIKNDEAKAVFKYISEKMKQAEKTEIDRTNQNCIYLSFQDGEPLYILSKQSKANIADALEVSDEHFFGVFWIHENDYMVFTATPMTSCQIYYKMPVGTYKDVQKMISK